MPEQTKTDPRDLLDAAAVDAAARAVFAEIEKDDDWEKDMDDEDRDEVRAAVRTAVVTYAAAAAERELVGRGLALPPPCGCGQRVGHRATPRCTS